MNHRQFILAITILGASTTLCGQTLKDSVELHFRQARVNVDTAYMDNAKALRHAHQMIDNYDNTDNHYKLTNVEVVGGASPEGSVRINEYLSRERAKRILGNFGSKISLPDSLTTYSFLGRDWQGLRSMVISDTLVPYRQEVIETLDEILKNDANGGETERMGNLNRIKQIGGGAPYRYLYAKYFPLLRESKLVLTFHNMVNWPAVELPSLLNTDMQLDLTDICFLAEQPRQLKPFYMAIKTNMLFDLLAIPNISAEFYLGKNISILANWNYAWWDTDRTHHYWRFYGGDLALRWWFGKKAHEKPLTGHHVGVYGGVVTYDFEFGGTGYMGGLPGHWLWSRFNWYCGAEYGYSLPISRRLNIDFTIGLGYLNGEYRVYDPVDRCYVWRETRRRRWVGPTKAEISLVWLIGRGNYNKQKGNSK